MGIGGQGFAANLPAPEIAAAAGATGSLGLLFGQIGRNVLEIQLNALQREGKLNILSSPSITTLDNQKAFTENGERIPFVSTDREGNRTVSFQDAVLRLEITPHVIDGKYLRMKIQIKKDEVDRSRTVDGNPFIIKKLTETTLIVNDGETIVISGLTKQKQNVTDTGLPYMMDLPFLRWLFKSEGRQATMEEVLIFITPTILPPRITAATSDSQPKTN
jgi:type IV pilus assembly protein PilQ